jgi:hypothetical protein
MPAFPGNDRNVDYLTGLRDKFERLIDRLAIRPGARNEKEQKVTSR